MENKKIEETKKTALHYMEILTDAAMESFLILDSNLKVILANQVFYQTFQVLPKQVEGKFIYKLGNGQWNIPQLRDLLEKILPEQKSVRNYEVTHCFENIGEKTMILNARQIDAVELIILCIEDITQRKEIEKKLASHTKDLEMRVVERTEELSNKIKELEALNKTMVGRELKMVELKKEIANMKKQIKNGNNKK